MVDFIDFMKLFGGFVYLLVGGDLLVRGSLGLAREKNLSPVIVGMTIVAMGTSAPELMVSGYSALSGHPGIAVGNVVGSNIANVLLVMGIPALIYPISFAQDGLLRQTSLMAIMSFLLILMLIFEPITKLEGICLLIILAFFLVMTTRGAAVMPGLDDPEEEMKKEFGLPSSTAAIILLVILGIVMLPLGANLVVDGAAGLAGSWGVSEAVIGLSLIALGTSLPELSTTVVAAFHRSSEVIIGNVIGSNLFNILAILGFTALLTDIPVDPQFIAFDVWVMLGCAILLSLFVWTKATMGRFSGVALLTSYFTYLFFIY